MAIAPKPLDFKMGKRGKQKHNMLPSVDFSMASWKIPPFSIGNSHIFIQIVHFARVRHVTLPECIVERI